MTKKMNYWEPEIETAPLEKLRQIQEEKARALVKRAYEKTALYRRKYDEAGVKPEDVRTLDDFHKLPLTSYLEDFVATSVEEKLAVPMDEVAEIVSTSGTVSGSPQPMMVSRSFPRNAENKKVKEINRGNWLS